jgi:hypothetical protein
MLTSKNSEKYYYEITIGELRIITGEPLLSYYHWKITAILKIYTKNYCWKIIDKNIVAHVVHAVSENYCKNSTTKNIIVCSGQYR